MKNLIEKYENCGFSLSLENERNVACCMRIKSKARIPKPVFHIRFRSNERMIEYCNEWISRVAANMKSEAERKEKKREAMKNMSHPFKVGQVLYNSWGYEQTNIDFYQVVEIKAKSIKIRPIYSSYVEGSEGFMCANVKPAINQFKGEAILKKVNLSVSYNGSISHYIKAENGCFVNYLESQEGVYSSWYA